MWPNQTTKVVREIKHPHEKSAFTAVFELALLQTIPSKTFLLVDQLMYHGMRTSFCRKDNRVK